MDAVVYQTSVPDGFTISFFVCGEKCAWDFGNVRKPCPAEMTQNYSELIDSLGLSEGPVTFSMVARELLRLEFNKRKAYAVE